MRRAPKALHSILALALLALPAGAFAKETKAATPAKPAMAAAPAKAGTPAMAPGDAEAVRTEILDSIGQAEEKLVALAEATPQEKLDWRPNDQVRSTAQVFLHVAAGNYFLPTFWGAQPPAGIDLRGLEDSTKDKAQVIAALKASYDHLRSVIKAVPAADMDRKVKAFGKEATVRSVFLALASHSHEHLGQSIAYARMNGIVPPWSQKAAD
jgi:uncharacterized damage-inducible protein DinB